MLTPFTNSVIRASAGSGKTYRLSSQYLSLVDRGVPPREILATTFTRKAAGEILDRILERLAEAVDHPSQRAQLAASIGRETLSRERCLELLALLVRQLHEMRVGTLDSFFSQVARGFSLELGLPPVWDIAEEIEEDRLRDDALALVFELGNGRDLLRITHSLTKGEAQRGISKLLRDTVSDLHHTFKSTAAGAWSGLPHFKPLSEDELASVVRALRDYPFEGKQLQKTRDDDCERIEKGQWKDVLSKGFGSKIVSGANTFNRKEIPAAVVQLFEQVLEHIRAEIIGQAVVQTEGTFDLLKRFDEHYEQLKFERGVLRFDDITRRLADAASTAHTQRLAYRLGSQINHLLLDEFQDTSLPQWRILHPLASRIAAESTTPSGKREAPAGPGSVFCVGDTKQAIYGWRGGDAEIFDLVDREIGGSATERLHVSRRCSQPVIDAVNATFEGMIHHKQLDRLEEPVRQWCSNFPHHDTVQTEAPGYAALRTCPIAEENPTEVLRAAAADLVAELAQNAPRQTIGVLTRTNQTVAKMIFLLRQRGLNANGEGGNPLTDSAAVQLMLSLLRLADHPGDRVALYHLAHSPLAVPAQVGFGSTPSQVGAASRKLRSALLNLGYGRTIEGYARLLAPECDRRERSRLTQLVELAHRYDAVATLRTDDFVKLVESKRVGDAASANIQVMTVHQSKGLEFDAVVLAELEGRLVGQQRTFVTHRPHPTEPIDRVCRYIPLAAHPLLPGEMREMFSKDTARFVAESLSVLYVAMTRARYALYMMIKPVEKSGPLPSNYTGLLRAAHTDRKSLDGNIVAAEWGDPQWYERLATQQEPGAAAATRDEPPAPVATRPADAIIRFDASATSQRRTRTLPRTAPSSLEGGKSLRLTVPDLASARARSAGKSSGGTQTEKLTAADSRTTGLIIHRWFEAIRWLEDGVPAAPSLTKLAQALPKVPADFDCEAVLSRFRRMLAHPEIAAVLSREQYAGQVELHMPPPALKRLQGNRIELRVDAEQPFALREGDQILQGSIDRLVTISRGGKLLFEDDRPLAAEVIDYKTDRFTTTNHDELEAQLAEKTKFYRPQLEAYRTAAARLCGVPPRFVGTALLFLDAGRLVRL